MLIENNEEYQHDPLCQCCGAGNQIADQIREEISLGKKFSKVLYIVTLYRTHTRALTFENVCKAKAAEQTRVDLLSRIKGLKAITEVHKSVVFICTNVGVMYSHSKTNIFIFLLHKLHEHILPPLPTSFLYISY